MSKEIPLKLIVGTVSNEKGVSEEVIFEALEAALVSATKKKYGMHIEARVDDQSLYTGNFTKDQNVEEILEYVCPALGLKYIRKSAGEYLIVQKKDE